MSRHDRIDTTTATQVSGKATGPVVRTREERRGIYLDMLLSLNEGQPRLLRPAVIGTQVFIACAALFVVTAAIVAEFPG